MQVFTRPDPSSGIPVYLQLVEQVKHAIASGVVTPGEQLPGVRPAAVDLVINPNTVVKAYRELEHEGFIEVRHGAGAFVSHSAPSLLRTDLIREAQVIVRGAVDELRARGVTHAEIRRLLESELTSVRGDNMRTTVIAANDPNQTASGRNDDAEPGRDQVSSRASGNRTEE